MKIYIVKDEKELSRKAANIISAQVIMKPEANLGLATGTSPIGTYAQLIEWYNKGDLDFSEVRSYNLDEYVGLPADHEQSYAWFMHHYLFDHVNIKPENIHIPNGMELDAEVACTTYDRLLEESGGIDLQLLGLGVNGHIGFNEPGDAFEKTTHKVKLTESTRQANARLFKEDESVPEYAYSMGIKSIMQARKILLIANGENKAEAVKKALFGPVTPEVPASILQLHNQVTVIVDEAAGRLIKDLV